MYASSLTQENQNRMVECVVHFRKEGSSCISISHVSNQLCSAKWVIMVTPWSHQGETESHHVIMHRTDREQAFNTPFIPLAHTKSSFTSVRSQKVKTAPLSKRVIAVTTQDVQVVRICLDDQAGFRTKHCNIHA